MHRFFTHLALVVPLLNSCRKQSAGTEPLEPMAVKALVAHLVDAKRVVSHAAFGDERAWTDSAILERAKELPPSLSAHLTSAPAGGPSGESMFKMLQTLESEQANFRAATIERAGEGGPFDCAVVAAEIKAQVNCVYVNYLEARYPQARFHVKGRYEPILLLEGRAIRAALMPVKL